MRFFHVPNLLNYIKILGFAARQLENAYDADDGFALAGRFFNFNFKPRIYPGYGLDLLHAP